MRVLSYRCRLLVLGLVIIRDDGDREVFTLPNADAKKRLYTLEMPEEGVKAVLTNVGAAFEEFYEMDRVSPEGVPPVGLLTS